MLIIMCGLPLTGKTTLSERLARILPAQLLSTDETRRELFKKCTPEELFKSDHPMQYDIQRVLNAQPEIPEKYQNMIWKQNEMVYEEMLSRARRILPTTDLILDGTFSKRRVRISAYNMASEIGVRPYLIYCVCSEETIRERIEKRAKSTESTSSNVSRMDIYHRVKSGFEEPLRDEVAIVVYNSETTGVKLLNVELGDCQELSKLERALKSLAELKRSS